MQLLTPLALLGALLAIPIILLYMLRLRRREVVVSSNFLWAQVIRDQEANTPWQRLRRNLLLILQLILLAAIVLALARPFQIVPTLGAGRIAVLIDASASMNATDSPGGDSISRFDQARAIAREVIDARRPDDVITLIRVGAAPDVLAPYTSDADPLYAALDGAQPGLGAADWDAALTLAAAGGAGAADFDVLIISDGGGALRGTATDGGRALPAIPGDLRYIPVGVSAENVGITALAVDVLPGQPPQLFTQIENFGTTAADIVIDLRADDVLIDAINQTIPAGSSFSFIPDLGGLDSFETVRVGVTRAADATSVDHLAADDAAWAVYDGGATRRVLLISAGSLFLEQGLRSLPRLDVTLADPASGIPTGNYDLTIFDGFTPPRLPAGDLLFIDPPESSPLFTVGALTVIPADAIGTIRVERDDPRLTYVDFSGVNLLQFRQVTAPWADVLIRADDGALLLAGDIDGRQVAIMPFALRDSDLPLNIQFPILLSALTDWFLPPTTVALPDGAVNLFDPAESAIAPTATITLGGTVVTPAQEAEFGQREYWGWLALAALAIALIEWILYHRRMRAPGILNLRRKAAL
ncbi:MAG: VWA domain-containing protein [Chloroflexota bacterium]|nr:VWA domain-containing protein [Chloroflexota bacterium]